MIFFSMSKGTKSFGHDKALACESRGFVYNKKGCIVLTHPLLFCYTIFYINSWSPCKRAPNYLGTHHCCQRLRRGTGAFLYLQESDGHR